MIFMPIRFFVRCFQVLIGTLWNVNINTAFFENSRIYVLIGTLWNVNALLRFVCSLPKSVLIGTLWNVNIILVWQEDRRFFVLIGTLWNVNQNTYIAKFRVDGFNRYIVECKYACR